MIEYEDGRYEGQVKNHLREGKGKLTFSDGVVYEGEWEND